MKKSVITGLELKEWYYNYWPTLQGYPDDTLFHEDCDIDIESLPDDSIVNLDELGYVEFQGSGDDPRNRKDVSVKSYIIEWRKKRSHIFVSCFVPKDKIEEFLEFAKTDTNAPRKSVTREEALIELRKIQDIVKTEGSSAGFEEPSIAATGILYGLLRSLGYDDVLKEYDTVYNLWLDAWYGC